MARTRKDHIERDNRARKTNDRCSILSEDPSSKS